MIMYNITSYNSFTSTTPHIQKLTVDKEENAVAKKEQELSDDNLQIDNSNRDETENIIQEIDDIHTT